MIAETFYRDNVLVGFIMTQRLRIGLQPQYFQHIASGLQQRSCTAAFGKFHFIQPGEIDVYRSRRNGKAGSVKTGNGVRASGFQHAVVHHRFQHFVAQRLVCRQRTAAVCVGNAAQAVKSVSDENAHPVIGCCMKALPIGIATFELSFQSVHIRECPLRRKQLQTPGGRHGHVHLRQPVRMLMKIDTQFLHCLQFCTIGAEARFAVIAVIVIESKLNFLLLGRDSQCRQA